MESVLQFLIENPLIELWFVTLVLVVIGYIVKLLKQPVLIWYILGWLILWPQVFNVIQHYSNIEFYAHFGVSLLLFMVWLWLNPGIVKEVGKVSTIAWVGQVLFTSFIWYWIALIMWFSHIVSLFIAIALTFSSTIVIVKLISDRGDSWTTYGKIALWILIVQDIIAMLILLAISAFTMTWEQESLWMLLVTIGIEVIWLLFLAWIFARYILPRVVDALAKQKELLLLFVITRAILFWWLWYYFWFSMEIWALLAWVTLASSRYRFHIFSELRPFRDFFLALFFVYLWWQIVFDDIGSMLLPIVVFSAFVLIGNPLIVITLMMKLWYNRKDSFMTWLTVAQISEFSFIVIWLALTAWIIQDQNILSLVTIIWLITMTWSSYMFANAEKIYPYIAKFFQNSNIDHLHTTLINTDKNKIIIVWYGRLWKYIAAKLKQNQIPFCILEKDVKRVKSAEIIWYESIYGDVEDNDTLVWLISRNTELVYSTVDNYDTNIQMLTSLKDLHDHVKVIVVASYIDEAEWLYQAGSADYVVFPHLSWATESWDILEKHVTQPEKFILSKIKNLEALQIHRSHIEPH